MEKNMEPDHDLNSDNEPSDAHKFQCAVCFEIFDIFQRSFLDGCRHFFCFSCIQQWARNKAECPLCRKCFETILYYNSEELYDLCFTGRLSGKWISNELYRYYLRIHYTKLFLSTVDRSVTHSIPVLYKLLQAIDFDPALYLQTPEAVDKVDCGARRYVDTREA